MENPVHLITPDRKESTAIIVMRCMLLKYAEEQCIPFEEALLSFSPSKTYEDLFDFETEIWKEGPDYLRCFYDEELRGAPQAANA